jgi:glycerophosphoryl diester phosphodiesterase
LSINIDVKSAAAVGPALDAIRRTNSWNRVRLAAFSDRRLAVLRSVAGPDVATGLSPNEILALKIASTRPFARRLGRREYPVRSIRGDRAAQVPSGTAWLRLVDRAFIETSHHRGIPVHVWTINRRSEMIRLLDLGVDGIMTDRADVLRDVLQKRGEWRP